MKRTARSTGVNSEVRCSACGALLGIREAGGLSIKRGDLQAVVSGDFQVALLCWRRSCRKLNAFQIDTTHRERPPGAGD
jgi:hypothetical protein